MDALDRAAVDGLLDLFFRSAGRVNHFREILVVQAEHFGTDLDAKPARDTLVLVHQGDFRHSSFLSQRVRLYRTRISMTGTAEQLRTLSATLPKAQRAIPLRPWVAMAIRSNRFFRAKSQIWTASFP